MAISEKEQRMNYYAVVGVGCGGCDWLTSRSEFLARGDGAQGQLHLLMDSIRNEFKIHNTDSHGGQAELGCIAVRC